MLNYILALYLIFVAIFIHGFADFLFILDVFFM